MSGPVGHYLVFSSAKGAIASLPNTGAEYSYKCERSNMCSLILIFFVISLLWSQCHAFVGRRSPCQSIAAVRRWSGLKSREPLYVLQKDNVDHDLDILMLNDDLNDVEMGENGSPVKFVIIAFGFVAALASLAAFESGIDVNSYLQAAADHIQSMGGMGYLYFGILYTFAEILAVPATPLTASAGYLFGLFPGVLTVLISATIAAAVSFLIGRSLLRDWAEQLASQNKQWRAIDRAVSKDAFRVVLLLRLSPLLPFALSNYLYALTSINFWPFLLATFFGFAPGTFGIVYAGTAGKALFGGDSGGLPWYAYAVGAVLIGLFANTIGKVASNTIAEMEADDEELMNGMS